MTTKQEERNALAKIRKIVESLGDNSYVGFAFLGAFEIAESNIDNDFADSCRDYMDKASKAREWFDEATTAKLRVGDLERELDKRTEERDVSMEMCEDAQKDVERLTAEREELIEKLGQRTRQAVDSAVEMMAHQKEAEELAEQLKEAREEVKELKAKLYDYIVTEG